jgi:hypothetical protein
MGSLIREPSHHREGINAWIMETVVMSYCNPVSMGSLLLEPGHHSEGINAWIMDNVVMAYCNPVLLY